MKNEQAGEAVGQLMPQQSSGIDRNVSLRWWPGVAVASFVKLRLAVESDDDLAELTATFGEDQAQVLEYIGILRGMDLTREQTGGARRVRASVGGRNLPHPILGIEMKVWHDAQPAPSPTARPNSAATWPAWASTLAG